MKKNSKLKAESLELPLLHLLQKPEISKFSTIVNYALLTGGLKPFRVLTLLVISLLWTDFLQNINQLDIPTLWPSGPGQSSICNVCLYVVCMLYVC